MKFNGWLGCARGFEGTRRAGERVICATILAGIGFAASAGAALSSATAASPNAPAGAEKVRDKLVAAKQAAYDATFKNDEKGLTAAAQQLDSLASDHELGAFALYYAGWTRWMIGATQLQAGEKDKALATLIRSAEDLRKAVALAPDNGEFHCQLTSSLISVAIVGQKFAEIGPEIAQERKRTLELAPKSPRVVMMVAGMTFNTPAQRGGSQEKGMEQWLEAIRLFEEERVDDPIQPDWGRVLAYGWGANLYLSMTPPHTAEAKEMATKALALRPDFWYVKTQVIPKVD